MAYMSHRSVATKSEFTILVTRLIVKLPNHSLMKYIVASEYNRRTPSAGTNKSSVGTQGKEQSSKKYLHKIRWNCLIMLSISSTKTKKKAQEYKTFTIHRLLYFTVPACLLFFCSRRERTFSFDLDLFLSHDMSVSYMLKPHKVRNAQLVTLHMRCT